MSVHHIAVTTKDLPATHRFYSDITGFRLVKVAVTPQSGGGKNSWAKHAFYEIAPGSNAMLAVWELHEEPSPDRYRTDVSTGLGLPIWANHIAFDAPTEEFFSEKLQRWLDAGMKVTEADHDFCKSIYAVDPNGIMVEFCHTLRPFTPEELGSAERLLRDPSPPLDLPAKVTMHRPKAKP